MPTTTPTPETETVTPPTAAEVAAATSLVKLSDAVFTEMTQGGIAHVNATIGAILNLQPELNRELAACKRANATVDVKAGRFHKWMRDLVARTEAGEWKLDAGLTFTAASFKRDARAWSAYQNMIARTAQEPSLKRYVKFQERFKLGHYNSQGELTDAGKRADAERKAEDFKRATAKVTKFDDVDWSGYLDDDATDEDRLAFYHELAYWANAQTLRMEAKLSKDASGKGIVRNARERALATIGS